MRAAGVDALFERRTQALSRHFHQAKAAETQDFAFGTVVFQQVTHFSLDLTPGVFVSQVDKVDHDHAAEVAKAKLAGDFFRGEKVEFQCVGLRGGVLPEAAGVHIDGDKGFGLVDHQRPATLEFDHA